MKKAALFISLILSIHSFAQNLSTGYWLGRTTGKLPSITYSTGDDRLGSAKMGYLDSNVLLKIVDSSQSAYVVQLSKYHTAYIDKGYVKQDSLLKEAKPFYPSSSIYAKGTDSCYDILSINLEEHLPYSSRMEINPSKIILDIYGVKSNTNWITQLSSLKEIKNIYYTQIEDDVLSITIELKHRQHWGYSIGYNGKSLTVKVKRQPAILDIRNLKIAIDAGHGGTNTGAEGIKTKIVEKDYTLLYAKTLSAILKKTGVKKIVMTRITDTTIDMKDRILFHQQQNPDILISLHFNSANDSLINGSSTYYRYIGFRLLSQAILNRMLEIKMNEYGNIGSFNFALNAPTDFINCLLEIGFLSNEADEKRIKQTKFRILVANQIVKAINDWLLQCKK